MNKSLKRFFVGVTLIAMLSVLSLPTFAQTIFYYTKEQVIIDRFVNDYDYNFKIHANTNPTEGKGGARVLVTKSSGKVCASKIFPFYTKVSDLVCSIPSSTIRHLRVEPVLNETIRGPLKFVVD